MSQVTVPQFIENEDKIMGPVTVRQFIIMFLTAILTYVLYKVMDFELFILCAILLDGSAAILAFLKVNGQPFHFFILHILQTTKNPSLRVWRRAPYTETSAEDIALKDIKPKTPSAPKVTGHRLHDISLVLDTGGAYHED